MQCKILVLIVSLFMLSTTLAFSQDFCKSDFNCNGKVDFSDYITFVSDFIESILSESSCPSCHDSPCPCSSNSEAAVPLPKTGQTISYATGDDGDLEMGVAWPSPRFLDHGNGTVTDNLTKFMWTKDANLPGGAKTWYEAMDYVTAMNTDTYDNFGYTDWRLPNVRELFSLIDFGVCYPGLPDEHPFINVEPAAQPPSYFWTSTTFGSGSWTTFAWRVCTTASAVNVDPKTDLWYVWPVRGGH